MGSTPPRLALRPFRRIPGQTPVNPPRTEHQGVPPTLTTSLRGGEGLFGCHWYCSLRIIATSQCLQVLYLKPQKYPRVRIGPPVRCVRHKKQP